MHLLVRACCVRQRSKLRWPLLVRAALCRWCLTAVGHYWSERRCADGFVESAVGHYFWQILPLLFFLLLLPPLLNWHKGISFHLKLSLRRKYNFNNCFLKSYLIFVNLSSLTKCHVQQYRTLKIILFTFLCNAFKYYLFCFGLLLYPTSINSFFKVL